MKTKIGLVILALGCLGLFIAFLSTKRQAETEKATILEQAQTTSNKLTETTSKVEELKNVNTQLEKDAAAQKAAAEKALTDLTNNYTTVAANLSKTETELTSAKEEVKQRDAKIADLEKDNQALDRRATDLTSAITNLNLQITDTQQKLAASEGDKAVLEKELKRLMGEKTELERQFNDLNALRPRSRN